MRRLLLALLGYICVAIAFSWPLPLHLWTALPGPVSGDTGVYVWNLWVFRHAIVAHREMPFFTLEILALAPAMPLTLQNYTTVANVIERPEGIHIAAFFIAGIIVISLLSRIGRSFELHATHVRHRGQPPAGPLPGAVP